jgi:hypothetical protein
MKISPKEPAGSYVLKVGEDTRRYAQEILSENERLRALVAALKSEKSQLEFRISVMATFVGEHTETRELLTSLEGEKLRLETQLGAVKGELDRHLENQAQLQRQLSEVETQNQRFTEEFNQVEQQNNNLTNLYVASYRLHGTLDRQEVVATIQEIIANLVGSEEQAIFETNPDSTAFSLVASIGIDPARYQEIPMGSGPIGRAGQTGDPFVVGEGKDVPDAGDPALTACIPLKLNDKVTGAIALFRLLPQKPRLEPVDHELFDLLATHAATALYCTGLHARVSLKG